jgi:hypothetical protein
VHGAAGRGVPERHLVRGSVGLEALRRETPVRPGDIVSVDVGIPAIYASKGCDYAGYVDIEPQVRSGAKEKVPFRDSTNTILPGPAATCGPLTNPTDHRYRGTSR